mmetsp:Transcript_5879/g.9512  ORF Transcript_5879/g.9512 Transcript_5879/m.9512 type:complete len:153 (-) Transcript_5879:187-645(-)
MKKQATSKRKSYAKQPNLTKILQDPGVPATAFGGSTLSRESSVDRLPAQNSSSNEIPSPELPLDRSIFKPNEQSQEQSLRPEEESREQLLELKQLRDPEKTPEEIHDDIEPSFPSFSIQPKEKMPVPLDKVVDMKVPMETPQDPRLENSPNS